MVVNTSFSEFVLVQQDSHQDWRENGFIKILQEWLEILVEILKILQKLQEKSLSFIIGITSGNWKVLSLKTKLLINSDVCGLILGNM